MILLIFLAALIGSILIGLPICFALLFSGVCMMFGLNGFNSMILSMNLFSGADSFSMMAVPFFVLAGEFMNRGGITKRTSTLQTRWWVTSGAAWAMCPSLPSCCLPPWSVLPLPLPLRWVLF